VHRNKFIFNKQPDALIIQIYSVLKIYMFRASSLPTIRSFPSRVRMELSSVMTLLGSGRQTCMKLTNAKCTVENSWWWAEKMPKHVEFSNRINLN